MGNFVKIFLVLLAILFCFSFVAAELNNSFINKILEPGALKEIKIINEINLTEHSYPILDEEEINPEIENLTIEDNTIKDIENISINNESLELETNKSINLTEEIEEDIVLEEDLKVENNETNIIEELQEELILKPEKEIFKNPEETNWEELSDIIEEADDMDFLIEDPVPKTRTYIYVGTLLASKESNSPQTKYYIQDHLGSNKEVVNGQIVEQENDFYAFGEEKLKTGDSDNDYLYTGKEKDSETGLYYYGARYYSPEVGRFMAADALTGSIENPLSMNRYAYVMNNPLRFIDPTGNLARASSDQDKGEPGQTIKETPTLDSKFKQKYDSNVDLVYTGEAAAVAKTADIKFVNLQKIFPEKSERTLATYDATSKIIYVDTANTKMDYWESEDGRLTLVAEEGSHCFIMSSKANRDKAAETYNDIKDLANNRGNVKANDFVEKAEKEEVGSPKWEVGMELIAEVNKKVIGLKKGIEDWMKQSSNVGGIDVSDQNKENLKQAKKQWKE